MVETEKQTKRKTPKNRKVVFYKAIANTVNARKNCIESNNEEWIEKHENSIDRFNDMLPSGCGIDTGTKIDLDNSGRDKIVLYSSYHVMDENGFYTHWIDFDVTVKASLLFDIDINVRGKFGRNQDIKEYLTELYADVLHTEILQTPDGYEYIRPDATGTENGTGENGEVKPNADN